MIVKLFLRIYDFKTATGEVFKTVHYVKVNVTYENKRKKLKLYFIKEDNFPLLFGRDGTFGRDGAIFAIFSHN